MTLQQLEYVVALADHGQFLKAAEACDVTQPTLSSMIQKLEEELGAKLFDRRSKPVVPTAVGRIVVEQARELLNGARRLREQVDEQQSTVCGEFSVAVLPTIAPYLLPRFLPEFSRKYPQIDLQISEMKTADVKRALLKEKSTRPSSPSSANWRNSMPTRFFSSNISSTPPPAVNCTIAIPFVLPICAKCPFGYSTKGIASATNWSTSVI